MSEADHPIPSLARRKKNPVRIGEKIHRLLVIDEAEKAQLPGGRLERRVRCLCECGNEVIVNPRGLRFGTTRSCGCYMREQVTKANRTHGESNWVRNTPEYRAWCHMKGRCNDERDKSYPDYGGRGIRVCDEWQENYKAFLDAIGRRPSPTHSLDRIDVNGNYQPGNVRWATRKRQNNNTRANRFIDFGGERLTLSEWSDRTGIGSSTIAYRIKAGWAVEHALTMGVRK